MMISKIWGKGKNLAKIVRKLEKSVMRKFRGKCLKKF